MPLEPRAWLLRLVHNACVDELRRARMRPVGDVELDGVPAVAAPPPDELAAAPRPARCSATSTACPSASGPCS